jgi:hypothetical protein
VSEKIRPRGKWSDPGVPHRGWKCVDIEDLGEPIETCEMCESQEIRYAHTMEHPDYAEAIRAGCDCAGKMEEDYERAQRRERAIKNAAKRRVNWLLRKWRTSARGNSFLNTNGFNIVVFRHGVQWRYRIADRETDELQKVARRFYDSEDKAKLAAFDTFIWLTSQCT